MGDRRISTAKGRAERVLVAQRVLHALGRDRLPDLERSYFRSRTPQDLGAVLRQRSRLSSLGASIPRLESAISRMNFAQERSAAAADRIASKRQAAARERAWKQGLRIFGRTRLATKHTGKRPSKKDLATVVALVKRLPRAYADAASPVLLLRLLQRK